MGAKRAAMAVWRWLLGRPEPREPMRRIVPITAVVIFVAVAFTAASPGPRRFIVSMIWLLIFVLLAASIALFADAYRRGRPARKRRRAR